MEKNPLIRTCIILASLCAVSIGGMAVMASKNSNLGKAVMAAADENVRLNEEISKLAERASAAEKNAEELSASADELRKRADEADEKAAAAENAHTVYIYDNGIEQTEYPVIAGAKKNDYNMELMETDEKKHKTLYDENGEKRSRFGIDVSSYQGEIDWTAAAADGVEFAIIRMGYRGYESGALVEDRYFRKNMEGAAAAGIDTGVYFYSQAINEDEAVAEAEYVLNILKDSGAEPVLPVVFDWEFVMDEDPARTDDMTSEMQTKCCAAFCERIKEAGYDAMYYSTVNTALFRYDMGALSEYALWIAEYNAATQFTYDYAIWQYSCSGVVDGINALTDLNIMIVE